MSRLGGSASSERHSSIDVVRGFAVMGILLMNIVAFALPEMAYVSPAVYGARGPADYWTWGLMSVLVDGKMRGLFSILFGASMLLVYERAVAAGEDGRRVHVRRMLWLLVFGLLHFTLIWFGDILTLYALCGLIGTAFLARERRWHRNAAIVLLGLQFVGMAMLALAMIVSRWAAEQPGASAGSVANYREMLASLAPGAGTIAQEIALNTGPYLALVKHQLTEELFTPLEFFAQDGIETLGLFALGMMLLRNGFLTGAWEARRYLRVSLIAYAVALPPLIALSAWSWRSGFDPVVVFSSFMAWSMPFRIALTIGHAALLMLVIQRFAGSGWLTRVEAAGRAAFSNYIGTSILMTGLFFGWGSTLR